MFHSLPDLGIMNNIKTHKFIFGVFPLCLGCFP